jgi:hypothetical protein
LKAKRAWFLCQEESEALKPSGLFLAGEKTAFFEIPILAIKIFFYCYHEILDASFNIFYYSCRKIL